MTYKTRPVEIKAWQYTGGSNQLETWRFQEWVKDELPDYVDQLSGARWIASTGARPIFNIKYINPTLKECGHIPFNVHSEKYFKTFFDEA